MTFESRMIIRNAMMTEVRRAAEDAGGNMSDIVAIVSMAYLESWCVVSSLAGQTSEMARAEFAKAHEEMMQDFDAIFRKISNDRKQRMS